MGTQENISENSTLENGANPKLQEVVSNVGESIFTTFTEHGLATDPNKCNQGNLNTLRTRKGLIKDLKDKNNLIYEGKSWAITTTIGPYGNHHIMLIYSGVSEDISHIGQIEKEEMNEYYRIMNKLIPTLKEEYKNELESGDFELIYGLNHSLHPGGGKSQSIFRPHTHLIVIQNSEKKETNHKIKKVHLQQDISKNKCMLALNKENLAMIKNFERDFLSTDIQEYRESIVIEEEQFYAIDFVLPGELSNLETIQIFEKVHSQGRDFLEAIESSNEDLINTETFEAIGNNIDKIGFSIGIFEENGKSHLRFRFSFKNNGEDAGVLEAMGHSIDRDEKKYGSILPDMSRIKGCVNKVYPKNK